MKRSLLFIFHLSLAFLFAMQVSAYKQESININVNGQQRRMVVFTPNELPAKSPLFIVTHGMNQSPEYQYGADRMYELIDTAKFVISYLAGINNTWETSGTRDLNFVSKTIDEMVTKYDIDKDRVYWSGFSMGSALIYRGMASMVNKIAAFAPTSGVSFGGKDWQKCTKPVNVIHCHAYGDDVFYYDQWNIRDYVRSLALELDECKSYKMTRNYRTLGGNTGDREIWSDGKNGTMVELFSYNANWHNPSSGNSKEIWNFCKRFSLNQPQAKITQPEGETTYVYMSPENEVVFPDINMEATATATKGQIEMVEFYDGNTLIETLTAEPYTATLKAPKAGQHELRVVVTDSNGKKGENSCMINCVLSKDEYDMGQTFTTEGVVPQNWYVSNGNTKRVGGGLPYTSGCRLLHFTNEGRAFEYGLMVQNAAGKEREAWARFGDNTSRSHMILHAGHYSLKNRLCNWNQSEPSPVTFTIETPDGQEIASKNFTNLKNIGGTTDKSFSTGRAQAFEFDILTTGDYVFSVYTDAAKNADFVLGMATLQAKSFSETGIQEICTDNSSSHKSGCFDLSGRRIAESDTSNGQLKPGLYIIDGHKVVIR